MSVESFKDLIVWQKSIELVSDIYKITAQLPPKEIFGIASQMQRAAVSIPSNIAEGSKCSSRVDFRQFCKISLGSAAELETQLIIVRKIYPSVAVDKALSSITEVQKMLSSLINKLVANPKTKNNKLQTKN